MGDAFELQDELQALQDMETYEIPNEHDIHSTDPGALLEGTESSLRISLFLIGSVQGPSRQLQNHPKLSRTPRFLIYTVAYLNTQMWSQDP